MRTKGWRILEWFLIVLPVLLAWGVTIYTFQRQIPLGDLWVLPRWANAACWAYFLILSCFSWSERLGQLFGLLCGTLLAWMIYHVNAKYGPIYNEIVPVGKKGGETLLVVVLSLIYIWFAINTLMEIRRSKN